MDELLNEIRNRISQAQGFGDLLTLNNFVIPAIDLNECIEDLLDQMCKFAFSPFNSSFLKQLKKDNLEKLKILEFMFSSISPSGACFP